MEGRKSRQETKQGGARQKARHKDPKDLLRRTYPGRAAGCGPVRSQRHSPSSREVLHMDQQKASREVGLTLLRRILILFPLALHLREVMFPT